MSCRDHLPSATLPGPICPGDRFRRLRIAATASVLALLLLGSAGEASFAQEGAEGPPPIEPVEVAEITARGVEASRARILADAINAVLDTLPTLEGYEDWRTTLEGEGRAHLWAGNPMAVNGIYHLSEDDFFDWSLVRFRMIEHLLSEGGGLDTPTAARCARLERGRANLPLKVELYNALEPELVKKIADLHARGWIAAGNEEPPSFPARDEIREALVALAENIRESENRSVMDFFNPEISESLKAFQDIVAYELRGNGHIVSDRSLCHYAYHVWRHFPSLDLDQRRVLFFLHLGARAAAERSRAPDDETGPAGRAAQDVEGAGSGDAPAGAGASTRPDTRARPEPLRRLGADEVYARGIERTRAEILAETFNAAIDTLRTLAGYEDWRATISDSPPRLLYDSPEVVSGVTRLPFDDLVAWADVQNQWISRFAEGSEDGDDLNHARCRQFVRQQVSNEFEHRRALVRLYNDLAPEEARRLAELQVAGLIAELGADEPLRRVTARELHEALLVLTRQFKGHSYHGELSALTRTVRRVMEEAPSEPYSLEPTRSGPTDREYCLHADAVTLAAPDLAPAHLRILLRWLYDPAIR